MPELPEVETIKDYLRKFLRGKIILDFENFDRKRIKIKAKEIIGEKILNVRRRGKILILQLTNGKAICLHLKMTGQLLYTHTKNISKFTRAIFKLCSLSLVNDNTIANVNKQFRITIDNCVDLRYLIFNDARKFGWIKLNCDEFKKLGIEPFSKKFNFKNIQKIFQSAKRPIKLVLMDQTKIAGLGNIYANEALFLAKINPLIFANALTNKEIKALKNSILKVLNKALKYEGTSSRSYIKPDQSKGKYQEKFLVYQRAGKKCFRCNNKIKKLILGGRGTFYCGKCQKNK